MMMQLRDANYIHLDDDVRTYNPGVWLNNLYSEDAIITFRQLATHMAGLPTSTPCVQIGDVFCNVTTDEILERLHNMYMILPPNTLPVYSNFGFSLLGHLLEDIVDVPYEEYITESIIKPLGLTGTGFKFTPGTHFAKFLFSQMKWKFLWNFRFHLKLS